MPSDGTARLSDAILGGVAGEVIGSVRRRTENSKLARSLRDRLDIDQSDARTKDLVSRALSWAADGSGASSDLIGRFAAHPDNRRAIAQLVTDPESSPSVRTTMAMGPQERRQLEILAGNLRDAVRHTVDLQLTPEARRILGSVAAVHDDLSEQVRAEHQETRDHVTRLFDERFPTVAPSLAGVSSRIDTEVLPSPLGDQPDGIAAAEAAKEEGRDADADRAARAVVASFAGRDPATPDERDVLRRAHRVLADIYIANPNTSLLARPHLEAILRLWDGSPEGRLTNRAILRLLDGDRDDALRYAEEALAIDPENEGARSVKANVLVRLGRADEAAGLYADDDPKSHSMRAWLFRMGHRFEDARSAAREVLEGPPVGDTLGSRVQAAQVFAEATLLQYAPLFEYGAKPRQSEANEVLIEAIGYLDGLLSSVDDQRPAVRADALLYRASLYEWTGRPGAREDMEEAVCLQPDNDRAVRNLVVLLTSAEEFDRAAELAERLLDLDSSPEAARLAISVALQSGDLDRAVSQLQSLASDPAASPDAAEAAIMLADAYASLFRTRKAEDTLDAVEAGGLAPFGVALARVRQATRLGHDPVPLLETAAALPVPAGDSDQGRRERGRWRLARLMLGDALLSAGDSDRAAEMLAPFVDPDVPDTPALRYAAALLNTGRNAECLDVCERALAALDGGTGLAVEFESVAAAVYSNLESFVDAAERYARFLPGRHGRTRDLVAWGTALIRLGQPDRALDVLRLAESRVTDDAARLAIVGNAYAEAGDLSKALDLAYRALDLAFDDERFHRNFAGLFLTHSDEISAAGPLDRKYLDRFHDILHHHAERFPSETPFVRMEKIPEDPDEMVAKLVELVRPVHEAQKSIRGRLLKGGRSPLSAIADLLGRNQVEAWEAVTSNREWGRLAFPGGHRDRARSVREARSATTVVADPSALLTLHGLGMLREALRSFDEVLVPQGFVDELHHAVHVNRSNPEGTRMYMGLDESGTSLSITEVHPDIARLHRERVEDLYETLTFGATDPATRLCRIVGRPPSPPGPVAGDDPAAFVEVLGDAGEAAIVSEFRGVPLLSDGFMVRTAVKVAGLATTDSYAVLDRLIQDGGIPPSRLEDARLQLISWGYRYVSMTADTLLHAVEREAGLLTERSRQPLDYLVQEESEPVSATRVIGAFLLALWRTDVDGPLPQNTVRKQWTVAVFLTLSRLMSPRWARDTIIQVARAHLRAGGADLDAMAIAEATFEGFNTWQSSRGRRRRAA